MDSAYQNIPLDFEGPRIKVRAVVRKRVVSAGRRKNPRKQEKT